MKWGRGPARPPTVQEVIDRRAAADRHAREHLARVNAQKIRNVAARLPAPRCPIPDCPLHKHEATTPARAMASTTSTRSGSVCGCSAHGKA